MRFQDHTAHGKKSALTISPLGDTLIVGHRNRFEAHSWQSMDLSNRNDLINQSHFLFNDLRQVSVLDKFAIHSSSQEYLGILDVFDCGSLHAAWHLFHLIQGWWSSAEKDCIDIPSLFEYWFQIHYPLDVEFIKSELMQYVSPNSHPLFWNLLTRLLIHGNEDTIVKILQTQIDASSKMTNQWSFLLKLVELKPTRQWNPDSSYDYKRFSERWQIWQDDVRYSLENDNYEDKAKDFIGVLLGDCEVLVSEYAWIECFAASILFAPLTLDPSKMPYSASTPFDYLIESIVKVDWIQLVPRLLSTDTWLAAHLCDIIAESPSDSLIKVDSDSLIILKQMRNVAVMRYVEELALLLKKDLSKLPIICDYCRTCGEIGSQFMEEIVIHAPFHNFEDVSVIVQLCKEFELHTALKSLLLVVSRNASANGDHCTAIKYLLQIPSEIFVSKLIENECSHLIDEGYFVDMYVFTLLVDTHVHWLRNLPSTEDASIRFLLDYASYRTALKESPNRDLDEFILPLFVRPGSPKSLWNYVFQNLADLFQHDSGVVITNYTICELMRCLSEWLPLKHGRQLHDVHLLALQRGLSFAWAHSIVEQ